MYLSKPKTTLQAVDALRRLGITRPLSYNAARIDLANTVHHLRKDALKTFEYCGVTFRVAHLSDVGGATSRKYAGRGYIATTIYAVPVESKYVDMGKLKDRYTFLRSYIDGSFESFDSGNTGEDVETLEFLYFLRVLSADYPKRTMATIHTLLTSRESGFKIHRLPNYGVRLTTAEADAALIHLYALASLGTATDEPLPEQHGEMRETLLAAAVHTAGGLHAPAPEAHGLHEATPVAIPCVEDIPVVPVISTHVTHPKESDLAIHHIAKLQPRIDRYMVKPRDYIEVCGVLCEVLIVAPVPNADVRRYIKTYALYPFSIIVSPTAGERAGKPYTVYMSHRTNVIAPMLGTVMFNRWLSGAVEVYPSDCPIRATFSYSPNDPRKFYIMAHLKDRLSKFKRTLLNSYGYDQAVYFAADASLSPTTVPYEVFKLVGTTGTIVATPDLPLVLRSAF